MQTFDHAEFALSEVLEAKRRTVTAVLPAREVADTVGPIVELLLGLDGLFDQVLVVDAASGDGSAEVAAAAGAEVVQQDDLRPDFGPVLGKGDAMWRSLSAVRGDLVVFLDSDSRDLPAAFPLGMVGPLLTRPGVRFVKGAFARPFVADGTVLRDGGGRVTELMARPLLKAFYPELAEFRQPLAGEIAAERELFERIPFATGYGVEIAMLIDVHAAVGAGAMAQVQVGERRQHHQPLLELGGMADTILSVVMDRLRREGRAPSAPPPPPERPPAGSLTAVA